MMVSAEKKRWIVVGIAIQVAAPVLRNCIKQGMDKHYTNLDAYCSHLTTPCTLKTLTHHQVNADPNLKNLKFQNVNNNYHVHGKNRSLYTYNINSSVDLAKLYLSDYLAQFSAFDDSLDMTAILRLLGFNNYMPAAIFSLLTQTSADDVRESVRNKWGHFDISEWSEAFFNDCFDKLETLVRSLGLTAGVEKSTLDQLNDWKTKGCQLCMGHAVDQNLLSLVQQDVKELIKKYKKTETEQTAIQASLAKLGKEQIEMQTTVGTLQDQQSSTLEAVQQWQEQQKKENEKTLERLVSVERTLSEELLTRVKGVAKDLAGVKEDLAEVKTRVEHMKDDDRSDLRFRGLEQRIVNTDDKVEQLSQKVKRFKKEDVKPEAYPVKPFDVKTIRSKLAKHYKTATVPTSAWASARDVEINDIYTRLSWVKKKQTPAGPSQSELTHYSDLFAADKNGVVPKRILVEGQTGIGKSTCVAKLTVDWAELDDGKTGDEQAATRKKFENNGGGEDVSEARNKEGIQDDKGMLKQSDVLRNFELVLVVPLKKVSSCQTLREVISLSRLFSEDEEISTDDLLSYVRNNQEKVLLVFDGYDEYRTGSEAKAKFGSRSSSIIYKIFHRHMLRGCTVLLTTRSSKADELQTSADRHAEITGFNVKDQKVFMRKMLDNDSEVDQLLEFLEEKDMVDLARVPLLNLFFCLLWRQVKDKFMKLEKTKTKLFRAILQHILQYGHKKHSPDQVSKVKAENYDEILAEIGKVALESLLKGNQVFEYGQLSEKVRGEQSLTVGLLQLSEYGASLEPMEMVSFIHKSIKEYLAAWYITNKCVPDGNLGGIEEHACTLEDCKALENVFQFICGLSNKGAVKVLKHLSAVRDSDTSLDSFMMDIDNRWMMDIDNRDVWFSELVLNCVREVSLDAELVRHWFDCMGQFAIFTRPLGPELLPKPELLTQAANSWTILFHRVGDDEWIFGSEEVNHLYKSLKFLNLCHIPVRITKSSEVLELGDFLEKFLNHGCECCGFSSRLEYEDGQIYFSIANLTCCGTHASVFSKAAGTISIQSLSANLCSDQSSLDSLCTLNCVLGPFSKDLGAVIRDCECLHEIRLHGDIDYACDLLEQVPDSELSLLKVGGCNSFLDWPTLTSTGAEKFAAQLSKIPEVSILQLDLQDCCPEAMTKLFTSVPLEHLKTLRLENISFTPAAAATLGSVLPKMTSLDTLELAGKDESILHALNIEALFGGFNETFWLRVLVLRHFHVTGNLGPLAKSLRFFPHLKFLMLEELDLDEDGFRLFLESCPNIPELDELLLSGNPLGHAVRCVIQHLKKLPKLTYCEIRDTDCSEEDMKYITAAAKAERPEFRFDPFLL